MKAVVYKGPFDVAVENVEDPTIQEPTDVIVQITSTCICGSDLHMYEGRTGAEPGNVFGHENQGIVVEVGSGVATVAKGDRVNLPFNIGCGFCANCEHGCYTGFCLTVNPGFAGGAYGYVSMGPYTGGQAEYLRVPFADWNAPAAQGHRARDRLRPAVGHLPDRLPRRRDGRGAAGRPVPLNGAAPVGIMAAYSSLIKGAAVVYVVDLCPGAAACGGRDRLRPGRLRQGRPRRADQGGSGRLGRDARIDAVGYQAVGHSGGRPSQDGPETTGTNDQEQPNAVLESLIEVVNPTGRLGIPGLYLPADPGGANEAAAGQDLDLLRHAVPEGPVAGDRAGERQELQPLPARPHRRGPAQPGLIVPTSCR